jgi:hypothetical protein
MPRGALTKAPLIEHGFKEASTDQFKIRSWWAKHPNAMIGVPTGPASGFWVLDIDQDKAKGKNGAASLSAIGHDLNELMDTAVANTATGGYHCLFRYDPARPVSNARGDLPKDIDVRGAGGYIIAAGSTKADGSQYLWLNPPEEIDIADAPEWLYEVIGKGAPTDSFDFNTAKAPVSPAERVERIAPGTWHENTRDLVARMVREGASDETIAAIAPRFTERGYTDAQTVREFLTHARTAREKWGYQPRTPEPEQAPPEPGKFLFNLTFFDDIPEEHHKSWLVRDIFGEGEFSIVYGAPGCGKSVLIGDAAAHVAAGLPWFGHATKSCAIIYVAAERHVLVKRRLAAWRKRHGIVGLPVVVLDGLFNFATSTRHGDEVVRIAEHIFEKTGQRVGWVIIDTKAQVMGGADENSSQDISVLNHNVARIQQIGAHVTIVDHTPQADPTRMKGNGGLAGAADGSFLVRKEGGVRLLTAGSKAPNDGPDNIEIAFSLEGVTLGESPEGKTEAPVVIPADREHTPDNPAPAQHLGPLQERIMTVIVQAARDGQRLGFNRLSSMVGGNDGSLGKALRKLCGKGLIIEVPTQEGGRFWTLP